MNNFELARKLKELAEEVRGTHPAVTSILYTVSGSLAGGTINDLHQITHWYSLHMVGQLKAEEETKRSLNRLFGFEDEK